MKILISLLIISSVAFGQTSSINKEELWSKGTTLLQYVEYNIDGETMKGISFSFQNRKYSHITDIGNILITTKNEADSLAQYLIESAKRCKLNVSERWQLNDDYSLSTMAESKYIYLYDQNKYTYVSDKWAIIIANKIKETSNRL